MAEIQTFKYDWREPDRLLNRAVGKSSDGQNFIGRDDDHQAWKKVKKINHSSFKNISLKFSAHWGKEATDGNLKTMLGHETEQRTVRLISKPRLDVDNQSKSISTKMIERKVLHPLLRWTRWRTFQLATTRIGSTNTSGLGRCPSRRRGTDELWSLSNRSPFLLRVKLLKRSEQCFMDIRGNRWRLIMNNNEVAITISTLRKL